MHATFPLLEKTDFPPIKRAKLEILQINVGYYCNLSCTHCHVNAGPKRTEMMDEKTADKVLEFLEASDVHTLDLTGGAPELNPQFRKLVEGGRSKGVRVIDRCNLTVLEEPGQEDLAQYLADNQVDIVASLPCYLEDNVNKQRGKGVFDGSIRGLHKLNALGYGKENSNLRLDLVFNPQGPVLPPPQQQLEDDYRQFLGEQFGIEFHGLLTLTNLPIQRFGSMLISKGQFHPYMDLLKSAYRPENLFSVMCKNTISIDYDGFVYDCDFNQMLAMPMGRNRLKRTHIDELMQRELEGLPIAIGDHCYGCTAGQGSSCGGALS
ncbi:radical SAM protein [Chromatiales bacterium (ex Bugula neritina AB1)]|nr:radical SAM protein [Chromatiales bacterium (ex Bugula neritina AB1)]